MRNFPVEELGPQQLNPLVILDTTTRGTESQSLEMM